MYLHLFFFVAHGIMLQQRQERRGHLRRGSPDGGRQEQVAEDRPPGAEEGHEP